jgi:hypothetical protein
MTSFGIAGLMIVGGTVAHAAPAEAAARKCAVGNWTLTKLAAANVATVEGAYEPLITEIAGGTGTQLKITPSAAIYDFSKSKPVILSSKDAPRPTKVRFTYRKSLTYGLTLTGAAKGTFTPKLKTVSGPATLKVLIGQTTHTARLAPMVKNRDDFFVIALKAVSTCTKKTLTLFQKVKESDDSITTRKISYRRTK